MKELIRTIKESLLVHGGDTILYGLVPAAGAVFGVVLVLIIMAVDGSGEDYGMLGTMLALMFGVIACFFGGIFSVQNEFNLAISMGKTRKYFVPARYLNLVLNVVLVEIVVMLTSLLEKMLYPALYPGAVCELSMDVFITNPGLLAGVALGAPVIILFFGVMLMKFTAKFFWVLWVIWMFGCVGIPRISHAITEAPDSFAGRLGLAAVDFMENASMPAIYGGIAVVIAALAIVTYSLFKRQRVTA